MLRQRSLPRTIRERRGQHDFDVMVAEAGLDDGRQLMIVFDEEHTHDYLTEMNEERGTLADFAFDGQRHADQLGKAPADGQSEARAADGTSSRLVELREALEDSL